MTGAVTFTSGQPRVARAWINFNGDATVGGTTMTGVRASFNVASVTDISTGYTRITFTEGMGDTNYAVVGAAHTTASGAGIVRPRVLNAGSVEILTETNSGADVDSLIVGVAIFR